LSVTTTTAVLQLEITSNCQLTCGHCYADSGPGKGHGTMNTDDWRRVITEAATLGTSEVQLIGGEPMTNPAWTNLVKHALGHGLTVEVYSNLYHVAARWWPVLAQPGVRLATSYYSDDPAEHDRITRRPGSHARTRANIAEAVHRDIPLRVGIVQLHDEQRVDQARADLEALGVASIRVDRLRELGRGQHAAVEPQAAELCGRCGHGKAAILPDGQVSPCAMARFLDGGNVRTGALAAVLSGIEWKQAVAKVPQRAGDCSPAGGCSPDSDSCGPNRYMTDCSPAGGCNPDSDSCGPNRVFLGLDTQTGAAT
jgi:MoaA/NifB/PqqE/SkfB family radical SAM enzyme